MQQDTIRKIRDTLTEACVDPRIKRIVLFGSHAKGEAQPSSDIDLYLDSDGQIRELEFFAFKFRLEEALQAEIDLIPDLNVVPGSEVENEIKRYGVVVYAA